MQGDMQTPNIPYLSRIFALSAALLNVTSAEYFL